MDPALDPGRLSNRELMCEQLETKDAATTATVKPCIIRRTPLDCSDLKNTTVLPHYTITTNAGMDAEKTNALNDTTRRRFNKIPWAHNHLNSSITSNEVSANENTNGSIFNKTMTSFSGETATTSTLTTDTNATISSININRLRPVSFSLPKRNCILLHQSATVFIQAGQSSGSSGKSERLTGHVKTKDLGEKVESEQPRAADVTAGAVALLDTRIRQSVGTSVFSDKVTVRLPANEISDSLCVGTNNKSGPEIKTGDGDSNFNNDVENQNALDSNKELKEVISPTVNPPKKYTCGILAESSESLVQVQPQESSFLLSNCAKDSSLCPLSRPKEPFYRVLSRDGSKVHLWPSEMISYTKVSPSISYSVNPLLYDFKANHRTKEKCEDKNGELKDRGERPFVIEQLTSLQKAKDKKVNVVKTDASEEQRKGGQTGSSLEVNRCNSAELSPSGCRDALDTLSCDPSPTESRLGFALGIQKSAGRGRKKKRRPGERKGMRKRGRRRRRRRRRGEPADKKDTVKGRRVMSSVSVNETLEDREEKRLRGDGAEKGENKVKGLLSNLAASQLVRGEEKKTIDEEKRIRDDQTERERAGRKDEKTGELLSNLPANGCNRCNQLCLQVRRETDRYQSQQSATGWEHGLGKLLCRDAACESVIRPLHGSAVETPRCLAITPKPAHNDIMTDETDGGKRAEKKERLLEEERRHLGKTAISPAQDAKENVCNLEISHIFACQDAAHELRNCPLPASHGGIAGDQGISPIPARLRETADSQRQASLTGHSNLTLDQTPRWSEPQTETEERIRPTCADINLSGHSLSKDSKRKTESPEAEATPRKRRKRGRRQSRRVVEQTGRLCHKRNTVESGEEEKPAGCQHLCRILLHTNDDERTLQSCCIADDKRNFCCRGKGCTEAETRRQSLSETSVSDYCLCNDQSTCNPEETSQRPEDYTSANEEPVAPDEDKDKDTSTGPVMDRSAKTQNESVTLLSDDFISRPTDGTPADQCQLVNEHTTNETLSSAAQGEASDTVDDCCPDVDRRNLACDYARVNDNGGYNKEVQNRRRGDSYEGQHLYPERSEVCGGSTVDVGAGQRNSSNSRPATDCSNDISTRKGVKDVSPITVRTNQRWEVKYDSEEKLTERINVKHFAWEKECVRKKQRDNEVKRWRERSNRDFNPHFPDQSPCYPHDHSPSPCIPFQAPLLLPHSSSFSFHHTIIQQHISLLPPPPPTRLPVPSYPQLLPHFSPNLVPLTLNPTPAPPPPPPPPLPPAFYTSSHVSLLDAPASYPIATVFHPMQSHHPPLYSPPHTALVSLQVLF